MGWVVGFIVIAVIVVAVLQGRNTRKTRAKKQRHASPVSARTSNVRPAPPSSVGPSPSHVRAEPRPRKGEFGIRWFGKDADLEVGGFILRGPCVYASSASRTGPLHATDPSEILLHAPVRRPSATAGDMGYWPWYSRIEPEHRFGYLSWLASGRASLPASEGYLFLFFYGIERRLLIDQLDRAWGLQEVVRLRSLDEPRAVTGDGRSFRVYSTGLLWFEIARTPTLFDSKAFDRALTLTERWTPELMTAPLAWLASRDQPLPAVLAREIAACDPTAQRSVVTKRVSEEFNELFQTRYRDEFGGSGLMLKVSKRPAWHTYRPASGGLEEMRVQVANPMGIPSQFKKLPEIWNSCIADLRKLSRVSASLGGEVLTLEAWEAMPEELRADVDHPLAGSVTRIVSEHATTSADPRNGDRPEPPTRMIPAGRLAELLQIEPRPTLTATQSRKLATTLEYTGYGLVPDARIASIRYGWQELVAVVPGLDGTGIDSSRYNAADGLLRLGLSVALADGTADDLELRVLTDHIDSVLDLSPNERQAIKALRDLLLTTGSDVRPVARKIQETLPAEARQKVGRLLVVIAAATNQIDRAERAALRNAFRALDLPPELLEETIAEIAPEAGEEEVPVRAPDRSTRAGEAIPAPATTPAFTLNHAAISTIMAETREVSVMLAEAMGALDTEPGDDDATHAPDTVPAATLQAVQEAQTTTLPGPGGRYEPLFLALIERQRWTREDADAVARQHGLMLDAGLETINDWAVDALGAPLVEDDGDELNVDQSLLREAQ